MILYIQCQLLLLIPLSPPIPHTDQCLDVYLRDRIAAHAESEPSSPQHLDEAKLEDCQFLYNRVYYILNTDFMFFPASERWADTMITELSRGSGVEEKYDFSIEPVKGVDIVFDILQRLTKTITPNAFHMSHEPSAWPNGHLWSQSVAQVNRRAEGSERVVAKKSILNDALQYYEAIPAAPRRAPTKEAAAKLRGQLQKFIKPLQMAVPLFEQQDQIASDRSPLLPRLEQTIDQLSELLYYTVNDDQSLANKKEFEFILCAHSVRFPLSIL